MWSWPSVFPIVFCLKVINLQQYCWFNIWFDISLQRVQSISNSLLKAMKLQIAETVMAEFEIMFTIKT